MIGPGSDKKVKYPFGEKGIPIPSRSDLDVIVIMILYEVRASKKRREWLDAICRLIIWTTLSSETSIPRANLTSTSPSNTTAAVSYIPTRTLQAQSDFLLLLQRHCTKRTRYLTR